MFIHVFFLFPETAGKTLEDVDHVFNDPNGIKYIGTPAWKTHVHFREILEVERHGSVMDEEKLAQFNEHRVERTDSEKS